MKTELRYLAAFLVSAVLTVGWEVSGFGRVPAADTDLIEVHRNALSYPGCMDCSDARYDRHGDCRPGFQCIRFDRGQLHGIDRPTHRAARRPPSPTYWRI